MIGALTMLLVFQLAGEVLVRLLAMPVPGPVAGMLLLFLALLIRGREPVALKAGAQALLNHLSLLFIPAGSGVIAYAALIRQAWLPMLLTLVLSTALTLAVTALVLRWLLRFRR